MILVYKLIKILVMYTDIHIVIFKSAKLLLTTKKNLFYRSILMLFLNNIKLIFSFKKSVWSWNLWRVFKGCPVIFKGVFDTHVSLKQIIINL